MTINHSYRILEIKIITLKALKRDPGDDSSISGVEISVAQHLLKINKDGILNATMAPVDNFTVPIESNVAKRFVALLFPRVAIISVSVCQ